MTATPNGLPPVLSIAVRTEPSPAALAVAVEHAGDASARAGSAGTALPLSLTRVLMPAGVVADEPARPGVQPAQTTPIARSDAPARAAPARDVAAHSLMPRWYVRFTVRDPRRQLSSAKPHLDS